MNDTDDIIKSRNHEMRTYLASMAALYENALAKNAETYDIAFRLTEGFARIEQGAILEDSRIVKVLRYAIAPSISQMKFGQMFSLSSLKGIEERRVSKGSAHYGTLRNIAAEMAKFASERLDKARFIWVSNPEHDSELARNYAKKWTCSIAGIQNAETVYRGWRKEQQELAIVGQLISMGYLQSSMRGAIQQQSDLKIGEYTSERKVRARTVQKADLAFRSKRSGRLTLIEAKTVGVEIDATKRSKECCDKANDWKSASLLGPPDVIAVIAGFFTQTNLDNLRASGVRVIWEHRLADLDREA
jgi:hypothetical protein